MPLIRKSTVRRWAEPLAKWNLVSADYEIDEIGNQIIINQKPTDGELGAWQIKITRNVEGESTVTVNLKVGAIYANNEVLTLSGYNIGDIYELVIVKADTPVYIALTAQVTPSVSEWTTRFPPAAINRQYGINALDLGTVTITLDNDEQVAIASQVDGSTGSVTNGRWIAFIGEVGPDTFDLDDDGDDEEIVATSYLSARPISVQSGLISLDSPVTSLTIQN